MLTVTELSTTSHEFVEDANGMGRGHANYDKFQLSLESFDSLSTNERARRIHWLVTRIPESADQLTCGNRAAGVTGWEIAG